MKKGTTNNPNGRKKGVPNKSTTQAREAIAKLVDKNSVNMMRWLEEIAADNPKDAFDCMIKVMEYHLPKIARVEHTGKDGEAIDHNVTVTFVGEKIKREDVSVHISPTFVTNNDKIEE
jgi:hypothetical protein